MKYGRTYNFSAGPATMPEPVLEEIRDEMMNYRGSGMCVMEMSHRSKVFQQIIDEAEADLRELMNIPDNYKVLFIQGGATLQFAMIPMNLMKNGKAVYIETGAWSKKAIAEAKKYGEVIVAASSKDKNFSYIPDCSDLDIPEDTDYVYICENETIHGVTWPKLPNTKGHILVSDQSSMFLSKPCNVADYGMIYGGVQKNIGPAGLAIVIIREDLIREDLDPKTPIYMSYKTHADNGSMYNTPNCWAIYVCGKVFKYLKSIGGLEAMEKINIDKAKVFYDFLDESKMFVGTVRKEDRSLMNIPFVTGNAELDAEVIAYTKKAGFENLKGHKSVGGLRASIYNAMPKDGVEALVECLKKFEAEHK
ncbi:MAG: 3-phosphoserine/phosphohydroxythreonine transaminase [Oscillospiraceae bacterium]|nr:3-phosphoserine/phosphohydroxythreonine transaminase [Oscillospiraceae bacterium]